MSPVRTNLYSSRFPSTPLVSLLSSIRNAVRHPTPLSLLFHRSFGVQNALTLYFSVSLCSPDPLDVEESKWRKEGTRARNTTPSRPVDLPPFIRGGWTAAPLALNHRNLLFSRQSASARRISFLLSIFISPALPFIPLFDTLFLTHQVKSPDGPSQCVLVCRLVSCSRKQEHLSRQKAKNETGGDD